MFISEAVHSHSIKIWIAGDYELAKIAMREFCDKVGFCVSVTRSCYIYTGGQEDGVIVGLINYPRFPLGPEALEAKAIAIGLFLLDRLEQQSFTIERNQETKWYSNREGDNETATTPK
jgi:hypothetical protein